MLHSSCIIGQSLTREQLTGTWAGVHTQWDTDDYCPLPTYITLDADSTYHLGMIDGSATERISTWAVHGQSVRLDTVHFGPNLVRVQPDLLSIGTTYPLTFRRFSPVPIDSTHAYQLLAGRVWQADSLILYLYANGQVALENPITKQRTAHFWRLARFRTALFLVIRGNQYSPESSYKPLWQITSLSAEQLQAIGWNGHHVGTETFRLIRRLSSNESCRPTGFQPCDNCFQQRLYRRFTNHYELNHVFLTHYQPVRLSGQSGLLHVQFVVNCQGECSPVLIQGFGEDYCPRTFAPLITDQFITICRRQVATDPTLLMNNRDDPEKHDVAVSLTFRLKEGRITDVLP